MSGPLRTSTKLAASTLRVPIPTAPGAAAYAMLGQLEQAIEDYDQAIRLNPECAEAYYGRGFIYKEQGKKDEAIVDFEKFITLADNPQWIEEAKQHIEELSE